MGTIRVESEETNAKLDKATAKTLIFRNKMASEFEQLFRHIHLQQLYSISPPINASGIEDVLEWRFCQFMAF